MRPLFESICGSELDSLIASAYEWAADYKAGKIKSRPYTMSEETREQFRVQRVLKAQENLEKGRTKWGWLIKLGMAQPVFTFELGSRRWSSLRPVASGVLAGSPLTRQFRWSIRMEDGIVTVQRKTRDGDERSRPRG